MRNFRKIDVLLNEDTGERFDREDIVKIIMVGYSKEYIGRINWIETLELVLDMSKEYKNHIIKIKYEDIEKIEKVK